MDFNFYKLELFQIDINMSMYTYTIIKRKIVIRWVYMKIDIT